MGGRIFGLGSIRTRDIIDYRLASVRTYGYSTASNIPSYHSMLVQQSHSVALRGWIPSSEPWRTRGETCDRAIRELTPLT
jgi:hypothetical protein